MDLAEHGTVRRDDRDSLGDRGRHEQAPVRGEGHAVGHVTVRELAERDRLTVLEPLNPVGHRLGPVEPLPRVEGNPVRVDVW
jgi:hypothetical protein